MTRTIKSKIREFGPLNYLWRKAHWLKVKYFMATDIKALPNDIFKKKYKRNINWENPKSLIEKIYWLQLYSDTSLWTKCSDKYLVREYVKEKGYEETLNTLYGKWENANDIDWDALPESFVLKINNSCGQNIIVKNKRDLNIPKTIKQLNSWMNLNYGYYSAQFHYTKIKPCIIAEKLLINSLDVSNSLVDYKIWCFHGVPDCVWTVFDRKKGESASLSIYDLDWNNISKEALDFERIESTGFDGNKSDLPRPKSLEKMIDCAIELSQGIPQVRVDFYDIDGKVIFGEMTFTTSFGQCKEEYYNYLGSKIDLSKMKKLDQPNKPILNIKNIGVF